MLKRNMISIISPSLNGGGAEKVAVNLANYYSEIGYSVDLVVLKLIGPYESLVNDRVNLIDLKVSRTRYAFFKIRKYLKTKNNSMVLSIKRDGNIFVGLASFGLNLKSLTFREANTMDAVLQKSSVDRFLYKNLMKLAYYRADNIIANSYDTKSDIVKNLIVSEEKIALIRNPVLVSGYEALKEENIHEEWFSQKEIKVVLSVGRLHPQKNFPFLISAFKEVCNKRTNIRLIIVGEGEEESRLLKLIKKEGIADVVKLVSFKANIYPYYQGADVFALSSSWEGFGNVLVEALSVGLPIVSTDCPGGPKMILKDTQYGRLIALGDKDSYVNALLNALDNTEKRMSSMAYARTFTVESVAKDYLKVLGNKG